MGSFKSKDRLMLERVYGELYHIRLRGSRYKCVYCGDVRECLDHCPPLTLMDTKGPKYFRDIDVPLVMYPCCNACNRELGHRHLLTYEDRLLHLYRALQRKVEGKTLWTSEEINSLTGNLKRMVSARQAHIRRELVSRLRGVEARLASIDLEN